MVQVGTTGSRLERGLDAARAAVTPPLATHDNAGLMRNDAGLAIVIVSDENDCSDSGAIGGNESDDCAEHASLLTPVETYVETFRDLKPDSNDVVFAAVVGNEGSDEVGACPNASPGIRYLWTAELLGGVILPICDPFEDIMDTLGLSVSGIRDRFLLSHHAAVETITVEVQPESGEAYEEQPRGDDPTARGWTYDEASGFLIFWNEAVPARGAQITVTYRISSGPTTATG